MNTDLASRSAVQTMAPPPGGNLQADGGITGLQRLGVTVLALVGVFLALLSPSTPAAQAQDAYPVEGYSVAQAAPLKPSLPGLIPATIGTSPGDIVGDRDIFNEFCEEGQNPLECWGEMTDKFSDLDDCLSEEDSMGCVQRVLDAEDDEEEASTSRPDSNYSLYALSSANTAFLFDALGISSNTAADDASEENQGHGSGLAGQWADNMQHPANAGAFLGFCDTDVSPGMCTKYYGSHTTKNTTSYSYETFRTHAGNTVGGDDGTARGAAGVYAYALFGATTSALGLTESISTSAASSGQLNAERMFMGNIMLFAFALSGSIDAFFGMIIDALSAINPFRLFFDAVREADVSSGYDIADEPAGGPLEGLAGFISTVYNGLVNLGWLATIPMFIGFFAIGALLMRRYDTGSNLKRLVVRIFFLSLGFILLGSTYTATLESFKGYGTESGSVNSSKVVLNTYLDYDAWVNNTRMTIPRSGQAEIVWDADNQTPTDKSVSRLRMTTFNINTMANPVFRDIADSSNRHNDDMDFVGSAMNDEVGETSVNVFAETWSMLNRYVEGDAVTGEGFEGRAKSGLDEEVFQNGTRGDAALQHQFTAYTDVAVMRAMDPSEVNQYALAFVDNRHGLHSPQLDSGISTASEIQLLTKGGLTRCEPGEVATVSRVDGGRLEPIACNMSVLSQYNFLNTNFDSLGASVQSPERTDNTHARQSHAAVSQVGGGMMGLLYWFSALSILGSFIVIGIFYALSMLFSNIKRSIQLIAAVPFATLGFMGGIAKVIIYTVAMIVEIILTLFVYRVMQELILAIPAILEAPLVAALNNEYGGATLGVVAAGLGALFVDHAVAGTILVTLVATSGIIIFTIIAVKLRGTLISALDEAVTNGVNKLLDTSVGGGGSAGQGAALRRSLGTAGAMAVGHRLASGGQDDDGAMPDSGTGTAGGGGDDIDGGPGGGGFSNAAYAAGVGTAANEMFGGGTNMDAEGAELDENGNPIKAGTSGASGADDSVFVPASMSGAAAGAGLTNFGEGTSGAEGIAGADETVGEGVGITGQNADELRNAGGQEIGDTGVYQMPDGSLVAAGDSQAAQALGDGTGEVGISPSTGAQLEAAGAQELGEGSGLYQTPNGDIVAASDSGIAAAQREAQASGIDSALAGSDGHVGTSSMTGSELAAAGAQEISQGSGLYDTGGGAVVAASDSAVGQSLSQGSGQALLSDQSGEQLSASGATAIGDSGLYQNPDGSMAVASDSSMAANAGLAGATSEVDSSSMTGDQLAAAGATPVGDTGVYQTPEGDLVASAGSQAAQTGAQALNYGQTSGEHTMGAMTGAAQGVPDPTDVKSSAQAGFSALGDAMDVAPEAMGQMKDNMAQEMNISPTAGSESIAGGQSYSGAMMGAGAVAGGASMAAIAAQAARNRQQGMSPTEAMQAAAQQLNGGQGADMSGGNAPVNSGETVSHAGQANAGQPNAGQSHAGQPNAGQPDAGQSHTVRPAAASEPSNNASGNSQAGMMGMVLASQAAQQAMRPTAPERSINESVNGGRRGRGASSSGENQRGGGTTGAMVNAGMRGAMRGGMTNPMVMGAMVGQNADGGGVAPAPMGNTGNNAGRGSTPHDREDRLRESKERRELTEEMRKTREQREKASSRHDERDADRTTGRGPDDGDGTVQV